MCIAAKIESAAANLGCGKWSRSDSISATVLSCDFPWPVQFLNYLRGGVTTIGIPIGFCPPVLGGSSARNDVGAIRLAKSRVEATRSSIFFTAESPFQVNCAVIIC